MIRGLLRRLEAQMPEDELAREARRVVAVARAVEAAWSPGAPWWRAEITAVDELEVLLGTPFVWLTRRPDMIAAYRRTAAVAWKAEVALHEAAHGAAGLLAGFEPALSWTQGEQEFPGGLTRATRHPGLSATLRFNWLGAERRVVLNGGELGLDLTGRLVAFGLAPRLLTLPGGAALKLSAHDEQMIERALRGVRVDQREALVSMVEARLLVHPDFERAAGALALAMLQAWPRDLSPEEARAVLVSMRGEPTSRSL